MTSPHWPHLVAKLQSLSAATGKKLHAGVMPDSPAHRRNAGRRFCALKAMGADAVGMSTVMEVIAAAERGMAVAAISCITNKAAGLSDGVLAHSEVQDVASRPDVVGRLSKLVEAFVAETSN